ncbi:hypothetical protein DRQ23_07190 [bacterium]|nr:MAG: hypothetical protein DRQ23_07190 [bacterium]
MKRRRDTLDNDGLKSAPGSIDVMISLADLYIQNNLLDQAVELLSGVYSENPDEPRIIEKLIELYILKGNETKAKILLQQGLSVDKNYEGFQKYMKLIEEEKTADRIREVIAEAVEATEEVIPLEELEEAKTPAEKTAEEQVEKVEEVEKPLIEVPEKEIEQKVEEEAGVDPIKRVLSALYEIDEVLGMILSDETGLLIAENVRVTIDTESTGALLSSIYTETVSTLERLNLGGFDYIIFEFPRGVVLILASPPIILTVMCKKDVQEGLLLLKAKSVMDELKNMLGV